MKKRRWYVLILCLVLLTGCSKKDEEKPVESVEVQDVGYVGMAGEAPELNYEVTSMSPRVLTDQIGYDAASTKVVLFMGDGFGEAFQIVSAQSGEIVYTGEIVQGNIDKETGERVSFGMFTELTESGDYYIRTSGLGESYPFSISDGLYLGIFRAACLNFQSLWETEDTYQPDMLQKDAETICNLLIAYEYYTGIFQDDLGISESGNEIPDMIDIIRGRIDEILALQTDALTYEQLACYAGILAQFAQDYKSFNAVYASDCLAKAQEAIRILDKQEETAQDESYYYYALTQTYRASGYAGYHTQIKKILREGTVSGEMAFYGNVAYMSSKYTVDIDLCDDIINSLMEDVEVISQMSSQNPYLVCDTDIQEICEKMSELALVNYIITNHEYVTVQENHLHYLLGRNAGGISYIAGAGQQGAQMQMCISADSYQNSALVFMMSEIIKEELAD